MIVYVTNKSDYIVIVMIHFSRKRKLEEENAIVDQLIQLYAEQYEVDRKLLSYIANNVKREQEKNELLTLLDSHNTLLYKHPLFDRMSKRLFGTAKNQPVLTYLELSACFLLSLQTYPETVADMLWIDRELLRQVILSLEQKMANESYRLPKGYRAMRQHTRTYCTKR